MLCLHFAINICKELIDLIFEIWTEWAPFGLNAIGIEKKGFADQVLPLFDEEK